MAKGLKAIRGMNDILPADMPYWHQLESSIRSITQAAGYQEIRTPVLEQTELFARSIGAETDIVSKEMYTFLDRNEESVSLRPEGTACCVRAGIEQGLLYNQIQRLWYTGPMFRYEKPQKGRYRQFYQAGVEVYGVSGPAIEAELLALSAALFKELGLMQHLQLQLNHLGTPAMRARYREALVAYLQGHKQDLDEDSQRRLDTNPLRILDSKSEKTREILQQAPKIREYLDQESLDHLQKLESYLQAMQIDYQINDCLVRGLDYYDGVVFEWVTDALGAQGTVCAGGRYDGLVEQLGGQSTPAVGFAFGLERLVLLMKEQAEQLLRPDVFVIIPDESAMAHAFGVLQQLRSQLPNTIIVSHLSGGKIKNQFKKADKSGAAYALVVGEAEKESQHYVLKPLRDHQDQQMLTAAECVAFFKSREEA